MKQRDILNCTKVNVEAQQNYYTPTSKQFPFHAKHVLLSTGIDAPEVVFVFYW